MVSDGERIRPTPHPRRRPFRQAGRRGSSSRPTAPTHPWPAARAAAATFPDGDFLLVTVIDELEDPMADAGGFEGPVMDEKEAEEDHRAEVVEAQAALAATAHGFGTRPMRQRVVEHRGEGRGAKLCATAADEDADLLVVGSHGHGVLADALLGSISNYVVHHSTVPVLVVPPPREVGAAAGVPRVEPTVRTWSKIRPCRRCSRECGCWTCRCGGRCPTPPRSSPTSAPRC